MEAEFAESLLDSRRTLLQAQAMLGSRDLAAGLRHGGRMSSVRRFFCLYCTFDLLFTALIWLISVMLTGETIVEMWHQEVLGYSVKASMLDVPGVAALRFLLLIAAYAICHLDHWFMVAMTTSGTCAFLITKVFIFNWVKAPQPVFQVLLVLVSFALCWGEVWFLDYKVLPAEQTARHLISTLDEQYGVSPSGWLSAHGATSDLTSVADFYSPEITPESSPKPTRNLMTSLQNEEYITLGQRSVDESLQLLEQGGWRTEKSKGADLVESLLHPKYGKLYRLTGSVQCSADMLYVEFRDNVEEMPKWNPAILETKLIRRIDRDTDLVYQVTAGGGGGAVRPRDFVNLRRAAVIRGRMLSCGVSVQVSSHPPTSKYIRGENNVSCWSVQNKEGGGCVFQWLMGCNLKGWIPGAVLDIAFTTAMLDFMDHLREFAKRKQNL